MSKIYEALKRAERERELARDEAPVTRPPSASPTPTPPPEPSDDDDYRRLRASVIFHATSSELHTILVASVRHGEGATRTAVGLAKALAAEKGSRVLLVEANLRSPSLTRVLGLNGGPGVADFLSGHASAETLVTRIDGLNLSVVHAGSRTVVVDGEAIGNLIAQLAPQFDFTIIDAPPVNHYADASVLSGKVEGVVLVVAADQTPVADAEAAKRNLDRVGARILGVVLNRRRLYVPATIQALL